MTVKLHSPQIPDILYLLTPGIAFNKLPATDSMCLIILLKKLIQR